VTIEFSARTDVGRVRDHNEDNFLIDRKLHLYVVCDGMGGHASGEVASATAVNAVREGLSANQSVLEAYRQRGNVFEADVLQILEAAVQGANRRVYDGGLRNPAHRGMGTTLTALLLLGDRGFVGHVGDSRVYRRRGGRTQQMTEDHSFFEEIRRRQPAIAQTLGSTRLKNAITRAIGASERLEVDTFHFDLEPDDRFLLCSDGLHGYFDGTETPDRFLADEDLDRASERLIAFANTEGGEDNVTCILVRVSSTLASSTELPAFQQLRRMPLFRHLADDELRAFVQACETQSYQPGDLIFEEGTATDALHVLLAGTVVISSGDTLISRVGPGQYVGSITVMDGGRRNGTARASGIGPVTALAIGRDRFNDILREQPVLGCKLLWSVARSLAARLRTATERLVTAHADKDARTVEGSETAAAKPGAIAQGGRAKPPALPAHRNPGPRMHTEVYAADADAVTLDSPHIDLSRGPKAPDTADFRRPDVEMARAKEVADRTRRRTASDTVPKSDADAGGLSPLAPPRPPGNEAPAEEALETDASDPPHDGG
jgi:serine/threonine protein phosphatase PrpC/CRP-like cAMP-binding protein